MTDLVPRPDPDETGKDRPEFHRVRDEGRALRRDLRSMRGEPPDELRARAERILKAAVAAGAVTWDLAERDELDAIIARAASILDGYDDAVIEPFRGGSPTFREISRDGVTDLVTREKPLVSRRLKNVDLSGLDLSGAQILDCALHGCRLNDTNLTDATILHSVLLECELEGARLTDADVTSSLVLGVTEDDGTPRSMLTGVVAERTNFSGSRIEGVRLEDAVLEEAKFSNCYVGKVHATGRSRLRGAAFDYATVDRLSAGGADLRGALFIGTDLVDCDFADARLEEAIFSSAKLGSSSFIGARLTGASFRSAYFVAQADFDPDLDFDSVVFDDVDRDALRERWGARRDGA